MRMPSLQDAVEQASATSQRTFLAAKRIELGGIALAALTAPIPAPWLGGAGPLVTVALFMAVVALQLSGVSARSEARWYDARAAAESIKSAAWQYAVGGEAFRLDDAEAESRFLDRLRAVLAAVPKLNVPPASGDNAGVTPEMAAIRQAPLKTRMEVYRQSRVQDQVDWYAKKASWNRSRSRLFKVLTVVTEVLAIAFGIARFKYEIDADLLGVLAAIGAGLIAWSQAKKYALLSESYSVTSHEVNLVAEYIQTASTEREWAQLVHDSEAAFSREHTMWQARRQGP